ncbi:hypothetical protein Tco_1516745 [Tanacetum coccineum]
MASESSTQQQPQPLKAATNVHFECEDAKLAFNNSVALLTSKVPTYNDMLQFLTHCCISKALTIQPSAIYNKYLREFWYTAEVVDNTITFSLSHHNTPLTFDRDIFASVIGLNYTTDFVPVPSHEAVKDAITTLGLSDEKNPEATSADLAHSSFLRIRYFTPTWRLLMIYIVKCLGGNQGSHDQLNINQQMIAYALCWGLDIDIAGILFSELTKVVLWKEERRRKELPLTSYTQKVSKITPSEDATIQASGVMSLSGTSEHPVSKTTDKKQKTKKSPSTSNPKLHQLSFKLYFHKPLLQQRSPLTSPNRTHGLQSLGDVPLDSGSKAADESPYDTESEIKFVKRFRQQNNHDEPLIPIQSEINKDSDLVSIPDDDIYSISDSQPLETEDERETDKVLDDLTNLNASAERTSELIALKETLPGLLANTLKEVAEVFKKANAEGEKWEQNNPESPKEAEGQPKENIVEGEQLSDKTPEDPIVEQGTLVIYDSEVKASKKKTSVETDDEPPKKKLKFLIPTPIPLSSILPNPPIDQRKGKEIADEDEQMKQLVPLMDQSGSDPKALNL